ncbi:MAG: DUF4304 domain-containing protein [Aestuariivirga sp.]
MKFALMLAETFHPVLKSAGYRRSAQHWHKMDSKVVQVVNVQQSRWGNWAYVNCGLYLRRSKGVDKPKEYECDVRFRLEQVTPGKLGDLVHGKLHDLLSENPKEPNNADAESIAEALVNYGLPFLAKFESIEKIDILAASSTGSEPMVDYFAKELMDKNAEIKAVAK